MSEYKSYEVSASTLKDIIDQIPPEKWDAVIDEMKRALSEVKGIISMLNSTGHSLGLGDVVQFPDTITWVDDGSSDNTYHVTAKEDDSVMATFKFEKENTK